MTSGFIAVSGRWLFVGLACTTVRLHSADLYSVKDLGPVTNLPGRDAGGPRQINGPGQIAAANVTGGAYRAFLYGGAWTNLGTLGGGESLASGVNALGRVVGSSLNDGMVTRAFLWTPGGTDGVPSNPQMVDLGVLPGGTHSEAVAINGSGQITGYSQDGTYDRAFRHSGGMMADIGGSLGSRLPNSYGLAINDAGHVVGLAYNRNFTAASAFFYNGTTAVEIGRAGDKGASALAISNSDNVAGYLTTSNGFDHAFRHVGGTMVDLGTLGGHYSYGIGINNSNVIVGGSFIDAEDLIYHAFIARSNSLMDLNSLLDATGAGWVLTEARAINDAEQIAGVGTFGGQLRAFLLNPVPAPAAPTITSAAPTATGTVGADYSFQVAATGNPAPTFSATGLPPGLLINPSTGLISGKPSAAGTFTGTIAAANSVGTDTQACSITISATQPPAPVITGLRVSGSDALVSFTTVEGVSYALVGREEVASGVWIELVTGITGTGVTITVTDVGALALPGRFYRVRVNPP